MPTLQYESGRIDFENRMFLRDFATAAEALQYARTLTNAPLRFDGDFGQDEGAGEFGLGNDDLAIVFRADGSALVVISAD